MPLKNINPGIRQTVAFLQSRGFLTCDSGDGATHDFPCDRPNAYVVIQVSPAKLVEEANRLKQLLEITAGITISAVNDGNRPHIQATYDPTDETAFLDLEHVDDTMLPQWLRRDSARPT